MRGEAQAQSSTADREGSERGDADHRIDVSAAGAGPQFSAALARLSLRPGVPLK